MAGSVEGVQVYILSNRTESGAYAATEISKSRQQLLASLEYGDVAESEYQIWEYPVGNIYNVTSDRIVDDNNYYSGPRDDLWLPVLKYVTRDKDLVRSGYEKMVKTMPGNSYASLFKRIFKK